MRTLAEMADSDLGRLLAPLPLELLPCAVVAFRESTSADFDAVLRRLLAAGRFARWAVDLTQSAAAALRVRLTHAAAAGWLPGPAPRPDAAWLRALPSLLVPLSADAFPFMLAAFFSEMPDSFNRRLRALLASHDLQDGELVTEDVGSALRVKLLALAAAGHIPQPDLACEALDFPVATSVCPLCGLGLAPLPPLLGLMLRLAGPCSPARCGRAECTHCRVTCVACFWTKQGSGACAFHCHPRDAAVFPLVLEHSQPASPHFVRFVEPSLLHFLTFAVLHWRASFDGMARIWTRMWGHSVSCRVAMKVFHLWLYWRAQCLLADDLLCADARGIACSLGAASDNAAALSHLTVLVQETFLQRYCREHVCATCSQIRSVGVDNKVNLSVRLCADVAGCPRDYARVGLSVDFGCTEMPCPRSSFCRSHAPPAPLIASAALSACPLEHPLATATVLADGFAYTCDLCSAALPVGVTFHTCPAGCSYDVCRT